MVKTLFRSVRPAAFVWVLLLSNFVLADLALPPEPPPTDTAPAQDTASSAEDAAPAAEATPTTDTPDPAPEAAGSNGVYLLAGATVLISIFMAVAIIRRRSGNAEA